MLVYLGRDTVTLLSQCQAGPGLLGWRMRLLQWSSFPLGVGAHSWLKPRTASCLPTSGKCFPSYHPHWIFTCILRPRDSCCSFPSSLQLLFVREKESAEGVLLLVPGCSSAPGLHPWGWLPSVSHCVPDVCFFMRIQWKSADEEPASGINSPCLHFSEVLYAHANPHSAFSNSLKH